MCFATFFYYMWLNGSLWISMSLDLLLHVIESITIVLHSSQISTVLMYP